MKIVPNWVASCGWFLWLPFLLYFLLFLRKHIEHVWWKMFEKQNWTPSIQRSTATPVSLWLCSLHAGPRLLDLGLTPARHILHTKAVLTCCRAWGPAATRSFVQWNQTRTPCRDVPTDTLWSCPSTRLATALVHLPLPSQFLARRNLLFGFIYSPRY